MTVRLPRRSVRVGCPHPSARVYLRARPEISASFHGRRGARIARREEGACRAHVTDEQRSEAGCIGGQDGAVISGLALRALRRGRLGDEALVYLAGVVV